MHVYLAQLKCPSNHCVVMAASEFETEAEAQQLEPRLLQDFQRLVAGKAINPECGICHSTQLHVQIAQSRFATMDEARPFLMREALKQAWTAQMMRAERN